MKRFSVHFLPIALIAIAASHANAAVSIVSNSLAGGKKVVSSGASDLPAGSVVRVGFITDPLGNDAILRGGNFAALNAIFTPLGTENSTAGSGTGAFVIGTPTAGNWASTINGVENSYVPVGTQLYLWVLNNSVPANATEWGLYADPLWKMPDGTLVANQISITTSSIDSAAEVFRGSNNGATLGTMPVPEPSTAILLVGASSLFFARRRRA